MESDHGRRPPPASRAVEREPTPLTPGRRGAGLPPRLKAGLESLSGIAMDDVEVHFGSSSPATIGAEAYARGPLIHLAAGAEHHLPHEAWHVVQQKQGRVPGSGIHRDPGLEAEADEMGARAATLDAAPLAAPLAHRPLAAAAAPLQGMFWSKVGSTYQWRDRDPDDRDVPTQEMRSRDGVPYPVYVPRATHDDRIARCIDVIGNLLGDHPNAAIRPDVDPADLACWNWALTGLTGRGVAPDPVFGFVRMQTPGHALQTAYPTDAAYIDEVPLHEGRDWIRDNAHHLRNVHVAHQTALADPNVPKQAADAAAVRTLASMILTANGFEISVAATPYEVCVQYTIADGVVWDHWWLRVGGYTVETFPEMHGIQIARAEQLKPDRGVLRFHVTTIRPEHVDRIEKTLEDELRFGEHDDG